MSLERKTNTQPMKIKYEPLLHSETQTSLYPLQHPDLWEFYTRHISTFWTPGEVDLSNDKKDWDGLSAEEQHYLKMVLSFFANSDFLVNENLLEEFSTKVRYREAAFYYQFQIMMENIHSQVYADLIETYIEDEGEKKKMFNAVAEIPIIKKKAEWARRYIRRNESDPIDNFVHRLVIFAIVEGLFFSSSFCALFWLKKQNKMHGLTFSNELISRDEGLHRDFACHVYKHHIKNKIPTETLVSILKEATELEKEFCKDSIPVQLIGMNATEMCAYVEFVADTLAVELIGKKVFNALNPFPWMNLISLTRKTNFFERRVGEYSKKTDLKTSQKDDELTFDGEF